MIEPISCDCGKRKLNFKGNESNFKGATPAISTGMLLDGRNTREDYTMAVKDVANTQAKFISEDGTGAKLNQIV